MIDPKTFLRRSFLLIGVSGVALLEGAAPAEAGLIFHSTMDSAAEVETPAVYQELYSPPSGALPGPDYVTFVPGRFGNAAKVDNWGHIGDGPLQFKAENFDFDDPDQDGGRLDVWIRFDENPHDFWGVWVLRTNWPNRRMNWEISNSAMMLDVYGELAHNERTNYGTFRVSPIRDPLWENLQAGEWHLYTFLWRNNGDVHKDEIHYYIDGQHIGSDYNGNLPIASHLTDLHFCPMLRSSEIDVSFDEIYSFDSWDVSGASGNFADIQFPEGVNLTYPMPSGFPVWSSPITYTNVITFEFWVVNDQNSQCDCDLYVDGALEGSVSTTSLAHTEITKPDPLPNGTHTYQIKCDNDRIISPVYQFDVNYTSLSTIDGIGSSEDIGTRKRD